MKNKQQSLVRWDRHGKREQIRQLAERQGMKLSRFINWLADMALAQNEAEARFRAAAARGNPQKALRVLKLLDEQDARAGVSATKP